MNTITNKEILQISIKEVQRYNLNKPINKLNVSNLLNTCIKIPVSDHNLFTLTSHYILMRLILKKNNTLENPNDFNKFFNHLDKILQEKWGEKYKEELPCTYFTNTL